MASQVTADRGDRAEATAALHQIGAKLVQTAEVSADEGPKPVDYFLYNGKVIRIWATINDGIVCQVLLDPEKNDEGNWLPLFAITVPRFLEFTDDEKFDWIVSTPKGPLYDGFVAGHIRALPRLI